MVERWRRSGSPRAQRSNRRQNASAATSLAVSIGPISLTAIEAIRVHSRIVIGGYCWLV
jgi:hypothetical protein